jgi:hypothetical protein
MPKKILIMEKITKIYRNTQDKDGNPLTTRDGRPYEKVALKVERFGDRYVSGFGNPHNKDWQVGDEVDIIIEEKGEYLNFIMPGSKKAGEAQLGMIVEEIQKLKERVKALEDKTTSDEYNKLFVQN